MRSSEYRGCLISCQTLLQQAGDSQRGKGAPPRQETGHPGVAVARQQVETSVGRVTRARPRSRTELWAAGCLKKGEAPKRKREREEEVVWRRRLQEDRVKEEEELRLLAQLERFIPEEGEEQRERVRRIRENAKADPEGRTG